MKKRICIMLAMLLALVFAMAGCGSTTSDKSSDSKTSAKEESNEDSSEEASENTVKAFVESEIGQETEAAIVEAIDEIDIYSGFDMYAEGENVLVYEYKYIKEIDAEATAENLAEIHDDIQEGLEQTVQGLVDAGITDAECIFRYVTSEGEVIYEQKYPEE